MNTDIRNHTPIANLADELDGSPDCWQSKVLSVKTDTKTILFAFTPGQLLPVHTAPVEVLLVALEGSAGITVEDKLYIFTTGQVMKIPAKVPHSVRALSLFKMLLVK